MQEYFVSLRVVQSEDSTTFLSDVSDDDAISKSNTRILHAFFRALSRGGLETIACVKIDSRCYISIIYAFSSAHEKFDV